MNFPLSLLLFALCKFHWRYKNRLLFLFLFIIFPFFFKKGVFFFKIFRKLIQNVKKIPNEFWKKISSFDEIFQTHSSSSKDSTSHFNSKQSTSFTFSSSISKLLHLLPPPTGLEPSSLWPQTGTLPLYQFCQLIK